MCYCSDAVVAMLLCRVMSHAVYTVNETIQPRSPRYHYKKVEETIYFQ